MGNRQLMMMRGYTLLEILVVLTIISVIALFSVANYRTLRDDQGIKNSALDIQTNLRLAQTNATAGLSCLGSAGAIWLLEFTDKTTLSLKCQLGESPAVLVQSILLKNSVITSILGSCQALLPVQVMYAPLVGLISFGENGSSCLTGRTEIEVHLKHNNNEALTKVINIKKGGSIEVSN